MTGRRVVRGVLVAVSLLTGALSPARAEPVFPPGAQWGIEPPPGFTPSTDAAAFSHPSGAEIVIVSSARRYDTERMMPVGTVAGTGDQAMRIEAYEEVTVGDLPAKLMVASGVKDKAEILTLLLQSESAGMIMARVPAKPDPSVDMADVRTALLSARERPLDQRNKLNALPLKLGELDGMRVTTTVSNYGVVLTDGPAQSWATGPNQSFVRVLVVPLEPGAQWVPERDGQRLLDQLARDLDGATGTSTRTRSLGGAEILEASFEKQTDGQRREGVAFARTLGKHNVLVVLEAPLGGKPDVKKLERIFAGISAK